MVNVSERRKICNTSVPCPGISFLDVVHSVTPAHTPMPPSPSHAHIIGAAGSAERLMI